jgi:pyridoxal phosphate-dependent aminotransferase EpsN
MTNTRIYLSPPHLSGGEQALVADAFQSNWIAPLGPHVDAFEREFAGRIGVADAAAVVSGTAALHLALVLANVQRGDEVLVSTLTFAGSVYPIEYVGARPVFVDSEAVSWNIDPDLVVDEVERRVRRGKPPAAVLPVHLYGQSANLAPILEVCERHGIPVIEDAAEALGATYRGEPVGSRGSSSIFSFNGNKIITTSGGGMLVSNDTELIRHARKLAAQAREPAAHYEHREIGYNYRLSNVLAAIGRAQLAVLDDRVAARRAIFETYRNALSDLPGVTFSAEAPWGRASRWLTTLLIDPVEAKVDRETLRLALERENIESRPLWKPMHLQPVFAGCEYVGGRVAESVFERGLCLPSGSSLEPADVERVIAAVRAAFRAVRRA